MKNAALFHLPHVVYYVYDREDRLLYIGCTHDLGSRMAVHRAWGNPSPASFAINLYGTRVEHIEHPDYATAAAAEKAETIRLAPYFNRQNNPSRFRRQGSRYVEILPPYEPTWTADDEARKIALHTVLSGFAS